MGNYEDFCRVRSSIQRRHDNARGIEKSILRDVLVQFETVLEKKRTTPSWVTDFQLCVDIVELQRTLTSIDQNGFLLISVTQDAGVYTVFFRRPFNG